jgi:hypothetical protein
MTMRLNDDFSRPVIVHAGRQEWMPSPAPGVDRRMIFRIGDEKARATSIVRYAPGSAFPRHVHGGGEEFLVLDGVFQDEHGDYPAGAYIRNPPGTSHVPASRDGCTIFVRLWQFRADDRQPVVRRPGPGQASTLLFDDGHERVGIEDWPANSPVGIANRQGLELLVLCGGFSLDGEMLERDAWLRLPGGTDLAAVSGAEGARAWVRLGPLLHRDVCAF